MRVEHAHLRDQVDREAAAAGRAADRLRGGSFVEVERGLALAADVRVQPGDAEVFVDPDDAAAEIDPWLTERELEALGEDPLHDVARHPATSFVAGRISAVGRGSPTATAGASVATA
jgi:hypothetical protein